MCETGQQNMDRDGTIRIGFMKLERMLEGGCVCASNL